MSPAGCTPPGGGRWVTRGREAEMAGPQEPTLNQTDSTWTHSIFDFAFLCEENFLELRETMKSKVIHAGILNVLKLITNTQGVILP